MENIYNDTITILNKLKATDSITRQDVWYKNILHNAYWSKTGVSNVAGTTVGVGEVIKVLIPFSDNYKQYNDWKQAGNQDGYFTISLNDYIVSGEVVEDVTSSNVTQIMVKYGDMACTVRSVTECEKRISNQVVQLKIEGV